MTLAPSLVEARALHVHFGKVRAVDGVDLAVQPGETVGVVGESGCGKSTLGRALLRLVDVTSGSVAFDGRDITRESQSALRPLRRQMQIVFQDPYASLNPRMNVEQIVGEALDIHRLPGGRGRVVQLLESVGLGAEALAKFPHELSGGMRQRVGIARALAVEPRFLVCDEPVSALDASVRAQVVNLLADLRDALGLTLLFIAHDLPVVRHISTRVAVMYLGRIVEEGGDAIFSAPRHPYTKALLAAAPVADPSRKREGGALAGEPGSAMAVPSGCRFHPRCPIADGAKCKTEEPPLVEIGGGRVACWYPS